MQQSVVGNRWLSPELLSLAEQRPTPVPPAPTAPSASAEILTLKLQEQPRPRPGRPRRPARRQWLLHVAAGLLLIGSAAFSYLAWSDPGISGAERAGKKGAAQLADPVIQQQEIHVLRGENRRLHARIAVLREQLLGPSLPNS